MEDVVAKDTRAYPWQFFAIFDGHGGSEVSLVSRLLVSLSFCSQASDFAAATLWSHVMNAYTAHSLHMPAQDAIVAACKHGFFNCNTHMREARSDWPKRRDGHESSAGTTATTIMISGDLLCVANVGDSRAYLVSGERVSLLTRDHKPGDAWEESRVVARGGEVKCSRHGVMRVAWRRPHAKTMKKSAKRNFVSIPFLSMTRALGDFWSQSPETGLYTVSCEPDVAIHSIAAEVGVYFNSLSLICMKDDYCIMASDGLWDVVTGDQARVIVNAATSDGQCPGSALVNFAERQWASLGRPADNISVQVVFLKTEICTCSRHGPKS